MTVTLRGAGLGEEQVVAVARHGEKVALAAAARASMELSRARVVRAASSREPVYGVSTGFGALAGTRVAPLRQPELQLALIRSHAAGMGIFAALARPSRAGIAQCVVYRPCAVVKHNLSA